MRTRGNYMSNTSSGSPALRFGALFGLSWGVLMIANYYLVESQGVSFTTLATLVISLAVYLVAGFLAATQTGKTSTGLVSGLWTGLFSSLLNAIGVMILLLTDHALLEKVRQAGENFIHVTAEGSGGPNLDEETLIYTAIYLVGGILVATLVGLALGALGGELGESRAPESHAPAPLAYQESMYPGIPPALPAGTTGAPSLPSPDDEIR
jgi:hypothetical protein